MTAGPAKPVVALFGEVLADVFPERSVLGGAPFNVARHLRLFGLHPLLVTRIGTDALGDELLQELARLDIDASGFQRDGRYPTGQVRVVLENGGHRFDILPEQAYDYICPEATRRSLGARQPRLAYFGTLAQRSEPSRQAATAFLQAIDCPLFLDVNLRAPWFDRDILAGALAAADIVKLNDEELAVISALFDLAGAAPEVQAARLVERFGLTRLLVTCGAAGSWMMDAAGKIHRAAPAGTAGPVVDTVGAGDAFAAVFMLGLLHDWECATTLQRAGDYAAALCQVRGAAPPAGGFFEPFAMAWNLAGASAAK